MLPTFMVSIAKINHGINFFERNFAPPDGSLKTNFAFVAWVIRIFLLAGIFKLDAIGKQYACEDYPENYVFLMSCSDGVGLYQNVAWGCIHFRACPAIAYDECQNWDSKGSEISPFFNLKAMVSRMVPPYCPCPRCPCCLHLTGMLGSSEFFGHFFPNCSPQLFDFRSATFFFFFWAGLTLATARSGQSQHPNQSTEDYRLEIRLKFLPSLGVTETSICNFFCISLPSNCSHGFDHGDPANFIQWFAIRFFPDRRVSWSRTL